MHINHDTGKLAVTRSLPGENAETAWGRCPCAHTPCHPLGSYLTSYTVRAELPEAQGRLDASQQSHYIQVFDSAPAEATSCISSVVADIGDSGSCRGWVGSSLWPDPCSCGEQIPTLPYVSLRESSCSPWNQTADESAQWHGKSWQHHQGWMERGLEVSCPQTS